MRWFACIVGVTALALAASAHAARGSVELRLQALESRLPDADRVAALEKAVKNQGSTALAADVEQLKAELRDLRGQIEELRHALQQQQQSQRQLYGDLDRRLQAMEARASAPVAPPAGEISVPETAAPASNGAAAAPADPQQEQAEYLAAFELLKQGKTAEAIPAFQRFLGKYPGSGYAGNAQYWLGEANYVSKDYPQSLAEFQKLLEKYPDSPKLSGALLKIGYIHYETKNYPQAREVLERVKAGYPNTSVGRLAAERLERMRKEGV